MSAEMRPNRNITDSNGLDRNRIDSFTGPKEKVSASGKTHSEVSGKKDKPSPKVLFFRRGLDQLDAKAKKIGEEADTKQKKVDELVDRFKAGEEHVAGELFANLDPLVRSYVKSRYGGSSNSSPGDVSQEILLAVHKSLPSYERQENKPFLAFVYRIASNKVSDARKEIRKERADPSDQLPEDAQLLGTPVRELVEDQVIGNYKAKQLMDTLDTREKGIVYLRLLQGFSAKETAEIMGMPSAGAVRLAQHRAMPKIKQALTDEEHQLVSKQVTPRVEYARVLELREKGLSYPEIAEELDIPSSSVGYRLNRARKQREENSKD